MMSQQQIPIILASESPRRQILLEQIDLSFQVIPSNVHEDFSLDLPPKEFVQHYAQLKAKTIAKKFPKSLVIGADTVVVFDNHILGKPKSKAESRWMLKQLSGQTHSVTTGVSLQWVNQRYSETFFEKTDVTFNTLSDSIISYYINTYKPFDKAGSYGIQDWFSVCVKKVNGCFYNVMGFPLSAFYTRYQCLNGRD